MSTPAPWSPADSPHAVSLSEANAWRQAIDLCAHRIHRHGPDQQTDARLFLLALRQFLRAGELAAAAVAGSPEADDLANARDRFDRAVPDAKAACDMLEHFRQYAIGTGNLQQPGVPQRKRRPDREAAARDWPLGYDEASDVIRLGSIEIGVAVAREQVRLLLHAIWVAVRRR